jgi:hypothetical protein
VLRLRRIAHDLVHRDGVSDAIQVIRVVVSVSAFFLLCFGSGFTVMNRRFKVHIGMRYVGQHWESLIK